MSDEKYIVVSGGAVALQIMCAIFVWSTLSILICGFLLGITFYHVWLGMKELDTETDPESHTYSYFEGFK